MNTDTSPFMLGNFLLWIQVSNISERARVGEN